MTPHPRRVSTCEFVRGALVWGLILLTSRYVLAADVPVPPTSEAISRWVADLGSDSRAVRSAAEAALISHGSSVIELLPGESSLDPMVRESLERIVLQIERAETESALQPRRVHWSSRDVDQCLEELQQQTGNRVGLSDRGIVDLSEDPPREPLTFWQAIEWLGAHHQLSYRGKAVSLVHPVVANPLPVDLVGPFRVQLIDRSIRQSPQGQKLLGVKLRIECEPRLRPLFLMAAVDDWQARLGEQVLTPFTPGARRELTADRSGETEVSYDFLIPDQVGGQLSLTGEVAQTLSARSVLVTFSDLQARLPLVRRRGQVSLSLLSVRLEDQQTTMRVALAFPESRGLFESYRSSLLNPELSLSLGDGTTLQAKEVSQVQEDPDGNILEVRFATADLKNARLTAWIPTAISTQTVRFDFSRISLETAGDKPEN